MSGLWLQTSLCLEWIKKTLNTLTHDVIVHSFKVVGFPAALVVQMGGFIHCLKPGGAAHSDGVFHCMKPGGVAHRDGFIHCLKPGGAAHSGGIIHCLKPGGAAHSDGFIHCLKPGGVAHSTVEAIATKMVHLNSKDGDDDDDDPLASDSKADFETELHT